MNNCVAMSRVLLDYTSRADMEKLLCFHNLQISWQIKAKVHNYTYHFSFDCMFHGCIPFILLLGPSPLVGNTTIALDIVCEVPFGVAGTP